MSCASEFTDMNRGCSLCRNWTVCHIILYYRLQSWWPRFKQPVLRSTDKTARWGRNNIARIGCSSPRLNGQQNGVEQNLVICALPSSGCRFIAARKPSIHLAELSNQMRSRYLVRVSRKSDGIVYFVTSLKQRVLVVAKRLWGLADPGISILAGWHSFLLRIQCVQWTVMSLTYCKWCHIM